MHRLLNDHPSYTPVTARPPHAPAAQPSVATVSKGELGIVLGVILATLVALPLVGAGALWTRPLWMDELCTVFVSSHASLREVIANIAAGGDWAPPALHVIVWSARRLAGTLSPILLRSISLACVSLALLALYATLRRRVGTVASAIGVLAFAGHPLVIAHAFEARPYGPWLLFSAAYAWSLGLDAGAPSRRRDVWQAVLSVLLTTVHWFGVLSLGLMAAAAFVTKGRGFRAGARLVAPSVAGLVALAVCVPMVFTQRAAASGLLWVKELHWAQISAMLRLYWAGIPVILALILVWRDGLRPDGLWPAMRARMKSVFSDPAYAALLSLALMPVVLIVVSVVVQPSMVDRYGIVSVLAWAPLVAFAVDSLPREARAAVGATMFGIAMYFGVKTVQDKREYAEKIHASQRVFEEARAMHVPVVFQYMHLIYPVAGPQRSPTLEARFLDIPDSTLHALYPSDRLEWLRRQFRLERSQARLHANIYGFPILATQAQLENTPRFLLLATDLQLPGGYKQANKWGAAVFPNHEVVRLNDVLTLFVRKTAP